MKWPERFAIGSLVLMQILVFGMSAPDHTTEAVVFYEELAAAIAAGIWVLLRTIKFMFGR